MSKTEKLTERDLAVLELLNDYKWGKDFTCQKCGHKEYTNGDQPFGRRCTNSKCRYEESLFKYTALEGLRFSPEKVYHILDDLIAHVNPNDDEKMIMLEIERRKSGKPELESVQGLEDSYNEGESISLNELFARYRKGDISWEKMDRLCNQYVEDRRITISGLAKKYELQENTIAKFLERIDSRIEMDDNNRDMAPLERVLEFIGGWSLGKLLGFVMLPLDEGWIRGEKKVDGRWYSIDAPSEFAMGLRWSTSLVTFARQNSEGKWINYYNKPGEPEYLEED